MLNQNSIWRYLLVVVVMVVFAAAPLVMLVARLGDTTQLSLRPRDAGNQDVVCIDYPDLITDCKAGDELLLDDGRVVLLRRCFEPAAGRIGATH